MRLSAIVLTALATLAATTGSGLADGTLPAGKYYQHFVTKTCQAALCYLQFPAIPADKVLFVTSVDCSASVTGSAPRMIGLARVASSKADAPIPMVPAATGTDGTSALFVVHHDGDFYLSQGAVPVIWLGGTLQSTAVSGACSVIGRLLAP